MKFGARRSVSTPVVGGHVAETKAPTVATPPDPKSINEGRTNTYAKRVLQVMLLTQG